MKLLVAVVLGLVLCCGAVCQPILGQPGGEASFQGLGDLPGGRFFSVASAVSGDGNVVVGWSETAGGAVAVRWENGTISELASPDSYATAVSRDGSIVAGYRNLGSDFLKAEGFRWASSGGVISLGDVSGQDTNTLVNAVSADGSVVVGRSGVRVGDAIRPGVAARWNAEGSAAALPSLPDEHSSWARGVSADGSVIVGSSTIEGATIAMRWTADSAFVDLGSLSPAAANRVAEARAVSADGSVVVGESTSEGGSEAFRWTEATGMVGLGDLPGGWVSSRANAVSSDGNIVVGASVVDVISLDQDGVRSNNPVYEAFIWDQTHGMRRLADVLANDHGVR